MAPTPLSADVPEEASRLREENQLLRSENLRLRAAVSAARPETPETSAAIPSTPLASAAAGSGALGAADRLVHLMREGGHLLKEREALRLENEALESELESLADGELDDPVSMGGSGSADFDEKDGTGLLPDVAMVDRLMPLLSEGDALRTERETLRAERQELMSELEASTPPSAEAMGAGVSIDEASAREAENASDRELEQRFLSAVEEASRENASLEAEIKKLREENARLRNRGPSKESTKPPERRRSLGIKVAEEDIDVTLRQREAMAALLRKSQATSPSTARSNNHTARGISPSKKNDMDKNQEEALKGALHTLFRNFAR
mmetsp:Transcript_90911/g.252935  ORF Transcript_90911/g.252935 Transcript_90911/m.252935 type:complete len:324 (+) Transcript_90911:77-1048(+)